MKASTPVRAQRLGILIVSLLALTGATCGDPQRSGSGQPRDTEVSTGSGSGYQGYVIETDVQEEYYDFDPPDWVLYSEPARIRW